MLDGLAADSDILPRYINDAQDHVRRLFEGVELTVRSAESLRAQGLTSDEDEKMGEAADGDGFATVPRRRRQKAPPDGPPKAASARPGVRAPVVKIGQSVRHVGKQPPKRLLTDYFTSTKKVVRVCQDGKPTAPPSA